MKSSQTVDSHDDAIHLSILFYSAISTCHGGSYNRWFMVTDKPISSLEGISSSSCSFSRFHESHCIAAFLLFSFALLLNISCFLLDCSLACCLLLGASLSRMSPTGSPIYRWRVALYTSTTSSPQGGELSHWIESR